MRARRRTVSGACGFGGKFGHYSFKILSGRHRDSKPHVEVARTQIIVAYSRVCVYDLSGVLQRLLRYGHRHKAAPVSERPRIEDSADLADNLTLFQNSDSFPYFFLGDFHPFGQDPVGVRDYWK